MTAAQTLIRRYNRFNGKPLSVEKLKSFHADVQRHLDHDSHGPYASDLKGILQRAAFALKQNAGADDDAVFERIEVVPIDINKASGRILRVASGYEKKKREAAPAKPSANVVAEEIAIDQIHTDTKRFQNRQDAFSEASANSVAENYDPNKFDPIVAWHDNKAKKLFVLSGHSRYEGMKRRNAKTIAVRYFKGTEAEAIQFAKVEANRGATQETLLEDLAAYRLMRDGDEGRSIKKLSKAELQKVFKGKVQKLEAYSHLAPGGLFVNALSQGTTSNYPYLERNAQWIGQLRKDHAVISNTSEDNIFHFFYSDKSGRNLELSKDDFFKLAEKKVNQLAKDENILFPECSSDGCRAIQDREADPVKGESYKRLREINETLASVREKLTSKDRKVRVNTEDERKYLVNDLVPKLEAEKERIQRDLNVMDKTQSSLFGAKMKVLLIDDVSELLHGLECECDEESTGLGFTKDGQQKIYEMVNGMILKAMEEKPLFWRQKWEQFGLPLARNFVSNKPYNGANWVLLDLIGLRQHGFGSPFYMTFKQVKDHGGSVIKDAQGWPVVYYSRIYKNDGKKISEAAYNEMTKEQQAKVNVFGFLQYYKVFNGQEIEGIDFPRFDKKIQAKPEKERIESAEKIVDGYKNKPNIQHAGNSAHFSPTKDKIAMPDKKAFDSEQDYYSVLFHELVHSTGHKSRLNRDMTGGKDSAQYAFEELVAELGASYLCAEAGILYHTVNDSASYVMHYSQTLKDAIEDDQKFFLKAAAAAQKAVDYILGERKDLGAMRPRKQAEMFEVKKSSKPVDKILEQAALQDAIKAGSTVKIGKASKSRNKGFTDTPLFASKAQEAQASLFGSKKKKTVVDGLPAVKPSTDPAGLPTSLEGVERSDQMQKGKHTAIPLNDKWKQNFHRVMSDTQIMIWGRPGSRKTGTLLQFAQYLAEQGKKTLYCAREEKGRSTFDEKIELLKIGHTNLFICKYLPHSLESFDVIILDSVNALGYSLQDYIDLVEANPGKLYIPIVQSNKDGTFKGGNEWEHEVDIAGEVVKGELILTKNRYDPEFVTKAEQQRVDQMVDEKVKKKRIDKVVQKKLEPEIQNAPEPQPQQNAA